MNTQECTLLGTFTDQQIAIKFQSWINKDFADKHNEKTRFFEAQIKDNSEFSFIEHIEYSVYLICDELDWEYLIQRLRPAYLAIRACL